MIAIGQSAQVIRYELATGQVLRSFQVGRVFPVTGTALSPDGRRLAVWTWTGSLGVLDLEKGEARDVLREQDRTVRIWHVEKGRQLFSLEGHSERVTHLAWSAPG